MKYKAALFLIKNMPGHYTLIGKDSHKYRNIFEKLDTYPIELRDSVYFANANKLSESNVQKLYDIKVIKRGNKMILGDGRDTNKAQEEG